MSRQCTSASRFYSEQFSSTDEKQIKAYLARCTNYHVLQVDKDIQIDADRFIKIDLGSRFVHHITKRLMQGSDLKERIFEPYDFTTWKPDLCYVTWPGYTQTIMFNLRETFAKEKLTMAQVTREDLMRHVAGVMLELYTSTIECGNLHCSDLDTKLGWKGINFRQIRLVDIWTDTNGNWRPTFDVAYAL